MRSVPNAARAHPPSWPDVASPAPLAHDLREQLRHATLIAADAAQLALHLQHRVEVEEKGHADLVSQADRAVEALITRRLEEAFPHDHVIGEEESGGDMTVPDGVRCWYVDPIDGTTNYLKGLPAWGISMGLADSDGALLLGVIVLPVTGEVFTAVRGQGAQRNGVPIRCSSADRLDRTLVAYAHVGDGPAAWGGEQALAAATGALMRITLGTRVQGCSVADLTGVATGRIDATFAGGMSPWDVAAGLLIAAEAGVQITTPDGRPVTGPSGAFLATPPATHAAIRDVLRDHGAVSG